MSGDKIEIQNVNTPGRSSRVDRAKYAAMRAAYLQVLPAEPPGITANEAKEAVKPLLPQDLFPGGEKTGWWSKSVQLDLEAKGLVARSKTKPLRFYRVAG